MVRTQVMVKRINNIVVDVKPNLLSIPEEERRFYVEESMVMEHQPKWELIDGKLIWYNDYERMLSKINKIDELNEQVNANSMAIMDLSEMV